MPGPNASAEKQKGQSSATRRQLASSGAQFTTSSQPPPPPPPEIVENRGSLVSRGDAATLMSDRVHSAREAQPPLQDPRVVAVSRNTTITGSVPARTSTGSASSAPTGEQPRASLQSSGEDEGKRTLESRSQMGSANQLNQYREQLAKDMQRQGLHAKQGSSPTVLPKRVSPIPEESVSSSPSQAVRSPSQIASGPSTSSTNASTESGQTIRGGVTPGVHPKTPSYPFPRMGTPGYVPSSLHKPFTTLSPTGSAPDSPASSAAATATFGGIARVQDKIMSNPSTPASTMAFRPAGASQDSQQGDVSDFPTPNLYELSLMLTSEPGLEAWWRTVVHIMSSLYKAERLTLALPADSTDLENVPWGQKATYNARLEDSFSMEYMARGSSVMPSSAGDFPEPTQPEGEDTVKLQVPSRPGLSTRHSYTAFEDEKQRNTATRRPFNMPKRPEFFPRSQSFYPGAPGTSAIGREGSLHMGLNQQALAEHDAEEQEIAAEEWDAPVPENENYGRVFELLQALDYEADPLIDHQGVAKVLERGRVIALTRSYPYSEENVSAKAQDAKGVGQIQTLEGLKKRGKRIRQDSSAKLSNILSSAHTMKMQPSERRTGQQNIDQMISEGEPRRPPTPTYEEYEQAPPSPWSQSPAPSPAIRADPKDNPFFTDSGVDESSFDPSTTTPDYAALGPQEAIGVDNAYTVLHIPLKHPVLSKPSSAFKLDATLMEQKSSRRGKDSVDLDSITERGDSGQKDKQTPIAILSILSSTIPYPSNLRHSLEHLAPHLATSFSLCRHYSTLESEVTRMHLRRPRVAGFGAVDADGRPITDPAIINYASEEVADQSLAGSLTSPSEYSTQSRSAAGTPGHTPGWEATGFGIDKRPAVSSPAATGGDSYFTTKPKVPLKADPSPVQQRVRRGSKGSSSSEKRSSLRLSGALESGRLSPDVNDPDTAEDQPGKTSEESAAVDIPKRASNRDVTTVQKEERALDPRHSKTLQRHKKLHSHGGDFATTFQSLPPGSTFPSTAAPVRSKSASANPPEMAWPTDKLRDLILDALPAQLFVAAVPAGGIVWVNSRYIAYRGQTLAELYADPYASIHPEDRETYLRVWGRAVRTGEDFQMNVRIRRFDGAYRCFSARIVACRNRRNEIVYFLGSYTDIHEQTMAELKVVRQQEIEASEAKHRLLANLIPQIIFTATEDEGITFCNEQWLSYTGQHEEDALGLGFLDYVHPDDLARCQILTRPKTPATEKASPEKVTSELSKAIEEAKLSPAKVAAQLTGSKQGMQHPLSRNNSSSSESTYGPPTANLTELAKNGVVKIGRDTSGRLTYTTEIRLRCKGTDEYRWHLVRCVEIVNTSPGSGQINSYFGSATDINEHKLLEAKLKEAMESKSRFLSNMSHEIRYVSLPARFPCRVFTQYSCQT